MFGKSKPFGASPGDWLHFSSLLGLTEDLLPVVSNPTAPISPQSKMSAVGKTPSQYNKARQVSGIPDWTTRLSTVGDVARWEQTPDYGICIQTRTVRAIDVDVGDPQEATAIAVAIAAALTPVMLPLRARPNAHKFLAAFTLPGRYTKRILRTAHGAIEFLATGQQFVAVGTHLSGVHYEWRGGLPAEFPTLTPEQFERLWSALEEQFATTPSTTTPAATKAQTLALAHQADPVVQRLHDRGLVLSSERDGRLHITCPFEHEHTAPSAESATTYFPAHTGGYVNGHFHCLHAHCAERTDELFLDEIGLGLTSQFDDLTRGTQDVQTAQPDTPAKRFAVVSAEEFTSAQPAQWLVRDVLPDAELVVVFGETASGKTFFVLDLAGAVALGTDWRGKKVRQGKVVYIAAEGAGGFRNRLKAYALGQGVELADLPIGVIADAPNFMSAGDTKAMVKSIQAFGRPSLIVVDTFAQVMPGANENSGEDVGKALAHCKVLRKHTGATVLLVHHSGKDSSRGARGWSGLKGAADAEIEILRNGGERTAAVTKLKDGEDGEDFGFVLRTVQIGEDEDGFAVSSCVVDLAPAKTRAELRVATTVHGAARGSREKLILRTLSDMAGTGGPRGEGDAVPVIALLDQVILQIPQDPVKRDRRRELVMRTLEAMAGLGSIVVEGDHLRINTGVDW